MAENDEQLFRSYDDDPDNIPPEVRKSLYKYAMQLGHDLKKMHYKKKDVKKRLEVESGDIGNLGQELMSTRRQLSNVKRGMGRRKKLKDKNLENVEKKLELAEKQLSDMKKDMEKRIEMKDKNLENVEKKLELAEKQLSDMKEDMERNLEMKDANIENLEKQLELAKEQLSDMQKEKDRILEMKCENLGIMGQELISTKKQLSDMKNAYSMKLIEEKTRIQVGLRDTERFLLLVAEEKTKNKALVEENNRIKEEVLLHKNTIERMLKEQEAERSAKLKIETDLCAKVKNLEETVNKLEKAVRSSCKWVLHILSSFPLADFLAELYDDKEWNFLYKIVENSDCCTKDGDCNILCSILEDFEAPDISVNSINLIRDLLDNSNENKHQHNLSTSGSSRFNETLFGVNENCEGQNNSINDALPGFSVAPASTPAGANVQRGARSNVKKFPDVSFRNSVGRKSSGVAKTPSMPRRRRLSQMQQRFEISGQKDSNLDESVDLSSPRSTLNQVENPGMVISFSIAPHLKKRSVNFKVQNNQIILDYSQLPSARPQDVICENLQHENNADDDVVGSDEEPNICSKKQKVNPPNTSRASVCNADEENSGSPDRDAEDDNINIIDDDSDGDEECQNLMHVFKRLLVDAQDQLLLTSHIQKIQEILKNRNETQIPAAIRITLEFICTEKQKSLPLRDYRVTNNKNSLLPVEEHCIVKAYNDLGNSAIMNLLEESIHKELLSGCNNIPLSSLAALCRVYAIIKAGKMDLEGAKKICCELLKKSNIMGPYLVVSIASVWSSVLTPPNLVGSEFLVYRAIRYLMLTKPTLMEQESWIDVMFFLKKHLNTEVVESPETIIQSVVANYVSNSSKTQFSEQEMQNHLTAIELVLTRFDWSWMWTNVLKNTLFPFLNSFTTLPRKQHFGAVALSFRILGLLGCSRDQEGKLLEYVRGICRKVARKKKTVPSFIFREIYHAFYRLKTKREDLPKEKELNLWLSQEGMQNVPKAAF